MKNILVYISKIIFIISILIVSFFLITNIVNVIRIMFFGMTVGNSGYPDSIWFTKQTLSGLNGIKTYYSTLSEIYTLFEIPAIIICIIYQIIYFKIIRKK